MSAPPCSRSLPAALLLLAGGLALPAPAPGPEPTDEDLAAELQDVLNTLVMGAAKRAIESPQAMEVISAEQIQASGAFRLADVLRRATSVQVWALVEEDNKPQVYVHMGHLAASRVSLSDAVLRIARKP
jgi:outer membrane receptor for ferrienterochelin and colicin